jgi:transcription elongation factor Elf1
MACPVCRTSKLVEIAINMGDTRVTMHSCSRCDTRWWDRDGDKLAVDGILSLAAQR